MCSVQVIGKAWSRLRSSARGKPSAGSMSAKRESPAIIADLAGLLAQ